jgi:hypothetical protein
MLVQHNMQQCEGFRTHVTPTIQTRRQYITSQNSATCVINDMRISNLEQKTKLRRNYTD